jgi:DNA-binding HxlR family transcriptional regulator
MTARSYGQYCGVARALDIVGERWALLVVRELLVGPRRFTDLLRGLPGVGTNVLSARLRELERDGVVRRRTLPPPAASTVYELTPYGQALEEVVLRLGRWGALSLGGPEPELALRSDWLLLAFKAFFDPDRAGGARATLEIRLSDGAFSARVDGGVSVAAGAPNDADLVIETDNYTFLGLLVGAVSPDAAAASGALSVRGPDELLRQVLAGVALPEPTAA